MPWAEVQRMLADQAWFEEPELDEKGRPKKAEKVIDWTDNNLKAMEIISKVNK
jgi:hypothetical protein